MRLVKAGDGRLYLTKANTYQGNTQIGARTQTLYTSVLAPAPLKRLTVLLWPYPDGIRVVNSLFFDRTVTLLVGNGETIQANAIGGIGSYTVAGAARLDIRVDFKGISGLTRVSH